MKISACVLTHNNQETLTRTLESLKFVDEIIIVDDGSTDETLRIAKKYQAKIFSQKLTNFGRQRNFSIEKASNDWVLIIDTDEVVPEKLANEITTILKNPTKDGYYLPRNTYFLGKPIRHSGWYPDYTIRLFDKNKIKYPENIVHEKAIANENMGYLKNAIDHYSYSDLKTYFAKLNKYTQMQTKRENVSQNHLNLILMILKPIYRFIKMYFVKLGFLDGWRGLLLATFSAYYDFRVHLEAEKQILHKRGLIYVFGMIVIVISLAQGFLISRFGYSYLALPLFIVFVSLIIFNLRTALIILIYSILPGQVLRIYLSTGGGIILSDLVVPVFVMGWFFYKIFKDPKFVKSPIDNSLGVLLLVFVVTFIIAIGRFFNIIGLSYLLRILFYLALFWPLYDLLRDNNRLKLSEKALSRLFYLLIGLGVMQLIYVPYLFFLMPKGWDPHLNRMVSSFLDPNFFAAFLCIGFGLVLAKFYTSDKPILNKIWPVLVLGLAIILTFSRSGYVMLAVILLIFALFKDKKILIIGILALLIITFAVPKVKTRIMGGFSIDVTASYRIDSWKGGWKTIKNNFWFGSGYNNMISARLETGDLEKSALGSHGDAGNDSSLIVVWATTGLFGFLVYLFWYFQNIYYGFKAYYKRKETLVKNIGLAVAAIFLGLLVDSFFNNTLLYPHILILLMFTLAIFYNYSNEKNT